MLSQIVKLKNKASLAIMPAMLFIFLAIISPACEKVLMQPDSGTDPATIFEEVWTFTDRHYSFFEYKDIDWDQIYSNYQPLVHDEMNNVELFDLCADMLYQLKDGHVNLVSSFDRSRYWEWYLDSPENFDYSIIERNYFEGRQRYIGPLQFVDLGEIVYVYYSSFANTIGDTNLDILLLNLQNKEGLIFDVRNNGGGSIENARKLASRFTNEKTLVGYNYVKTGPGHEDFRKEDIYIEPHDGERYTGKVVVLTNRKSYSATTYFAQYMNTFSNVTFIGDTTGGGGGMPAFHDLPNGWLLRVSSTRFYSPQEINIESGIPPQIQIDMTKESMLEGTDDILEKAIEILEEGNNI
ncbi:MAG: S41 family peptidase [Bacteroidales bacterium]